MELRDEIVKANLPLWNKLVEMIVAWEDSCGPADDLAVSILALPEIAEALERWGGVLGDLKAGRTVMFDPYDIATGKLTALGHITYPPD